MTSIPELSSIPFLGNVSDIDTSTPHASYCRLADVYGEVFGFRMAGQHTVVINNYELLNEVCDEKRFEKVPAGAQNEVRNLLGDGLFTAFNGEKNWYIAHRILMPKFGPLAIKGMFDEMHDIACQLVTKWSRQGPGQEIDPANDFTRLTLDSIAICAIDTRFNSFYRDKPHPFVDAMAFNLAESGRRAFRPAFVNDHVYRASNKRYWETVEVMKATAYQAIKERQQHPSEKSDLLNAMLLGKDPKTGERMTEDSIAKNAITFLIAGHETTSGLLSFLFVLLVSNPQAFQTAQREIDEVIGQGPITVDHMTKIPYITGCIREALRLWPTAPGSRVAPVSKNDEDYPLQIGKNGYKIYKDDVIQLNLLKIHRDPSVYGADAELFRPERMLEENFTKLPPNAWKPFGNGMRACIGRSFALQEAHLATAMILQNFNIQATDPSYTMRFRQTLTIKPAGFTMRATLRQGLDPTRLERRLWGGKQAGAADAKDHRVEEASTKAKTPLLLLYGSNAGTCESLAASLAATASSHDYSPKVSSLDDATGNMPKDQPVIIITSSYEGEPPDNAAHFVEWLKGLEAKELQGTRYAVFGCGNHDWSTTFHKVPKLVNDVLEQRGATRIADQGLSDVAQNHVFDDFDQWQEAHLWPGLGKIFGQDLKEAPHSHGLDIEFQGPCRSSDLRQDVSEAIVLNVECLNDNEAPEKRHIEVQLPTGMTYTAGDYLAVLPMNPTKVVKAIMARFGLAWDTTIQIKEGQYTTLPQGRTITLFGVLSAYVELNEPITQKHLSTIMNYTTDAKTRSALEALTASEIADKHISAYNILSQYPSITMPFGDFLAMLPILRVRQYSISSSPLHSPNTCTLTYSVLNTTAKSGTGKPYIGTASTYLSELNPGDRIYIAVRPCHSAFHPPLDVANVPIIMICAGTGIAPFRAFVQQRAEQIDGGRSIAPALLFVGCRSSATDVLYKNELEEWARKGAVDLRYAFSRDKDASEGCAYVQERVWRDREDARTLWEQGCKIFVCGSAGMAKEVGKTLVDAYVEKREGKVSREEGEAWLDGIRNERYASDVFD